MKGRFAVLLKVFFIGAMTLVMLIPTLFIMNLIEERQARRSEASDEVLKGWGGEQTLSGPVLVVPFLVETTLTNEKGQKTLQRELHFSISCRRSWRSKATWPPRPCNAGSFGYRSITAS